MNEQLWQPGNVIVLNDDNVPFACTRDGRRAAPMWDRPWDKPDIALGGHIFVMDVCLGERVIVLSVSSSNAPKNSACVMTATGKVGYFHGDEVKLRHCIE